MGGEGRNRSLDEADQEQSDSSTSTTPQDNERDASPYDSPGQVYSVDEDNDDDDEILEDEESSSGDYNGYDYEFLESQGTTAEDLMVDEGNSEDDDIEEDDIDPDELSYEELIALGDFIGQEKRGLPLEAITTSLKPCKFQSSVQLDTGLATAMCVICQVEYEAGESLVALPCDHLFHSECITKWLQINKICPICNFEINC